MERFGLCDLCEIIQLGEQNSSHLESQIRMHCFEENETLIFLKRLWRHLLKTHLLFRPYALRNLSPSISAILAYPSWRLSKSTDLLKELSTPVVALLPFGPSRETVVHNCTIFLCSLDVRNIDVDIDIDDQCRGPSVKEIDHLVG